MSVGAAPLDRSILGLAWPDFTRELEQAGLGAGGVCGPFDAVMIAEDAELPAHSKLLAVTCGALKQSICFTPSKDVPTYQVLLQGHSCSTVTQFLMALYTDCLQLSSDQQAVDLHKLASQLGCSPIMSKCNTQIIKHTQTAPRGSSYAAALPWILAAHKLHVAGPQQLWAKNIAASYSKLRGDPLLQMLPKELLYSVMMQLATTNRQQKLQHDNTMRDLVRNRSGRATCKETEMCDGSFVQLYHFFCDQTDCRGHELRRTTTGLEESKAVHLQGSCHCDHAWLSHTDQCGKGQEEGLPNCMSNIRFEKIRVVDDTILEGGMPYVADNNEAYNSFTAFKESFDEHGMQRIGALDYQVFAENYLGLSKQLVPAQHTLLEMDHVVGLPAKRLDPPAKRVDPPATRLDPQA